MKKTELTDAELAALDGGSDLTLEEKYEIERGEAIDLAEKLRKAEARIATLQTKLKEVESRAKKKKTEQRESVDGAFVLKSGTVLALGDRSVTLVADVPVHLGGDSSEMSFVGALIGSGGDNFEINKESLLLEYDSGRGYPLDLEDQPESVRAKFPVDDLRSMGVNVGE